MFKLPANATNATFILCLITMVGFTIAREKIIYPNKKDIYYRNFEIFLTVLAIANYTTSIVFTAMDNSNNILVYPWISNMARPMIIICRNAHVRDFAQRYVQVMKTSLPMVIFIMLYVVYFTMLGERIF